MARKPHRKSSQRREPKEFEETVVQIDRVTKVVKGGRRLRFRATVVIGNKKGKVGIGIGKSHEVTGAIQKAIAKAKKELAVITLDGSTIPHDIKIKFKAAKILLLPASKGTGIIAGGTIRKVLELAGVKDILSKSYGTTNKVNTTKATFEALKKLRATPYMEKKAAAKRANASKRAEEAQKNRNERKEAPKANNEQKKRPEPKQTTAKKEDTKETTTTTK